MEVFVLRCYGSVLPVVLVREWAVAGAVVAVQGRCGLAVLRVVRSVI